MNVPTNRPLPALPGHLGVVGLGLMGASLARAARRVDRGVRITAVEPRAEVRARALADGVADQVSAEPDAALAGCGVVVLCTPVATIEALLAPVSALLADGAVLTDVGGAKERVVTLARERVRPGVAFVGAHPMFGGHGGYDGATAEKWSAGGTVAICTDGDAAAVEKVAALHLALGAGVERCTAAEHDAAVAMVSHLPYLVASALSVAVREAGPLAMHLAGPGLKDATRLAEFPFDIQGEVARRNAHLPEAARRLERHLARILAAIAESPESARSALEAARAAREELF
ncbi:prephenate dehydrogenase [Anaeromyxobacter dehalogenans]|uniref:Prephenate dehydrogenase n=1 Tax=Anaeromyxobacter dehalogenans (strain 2CP-C) TaxID=290397 RepID=Q2IMC9_ANADE|nr:prephenate dehydrogenase [Anaeromyxobacter dehalogenans]ABC79960.1 prephenate dehydrogenase [Anaeromyxobacter dehalogenans 2CP-C]